MASKENAFMVFSSHFEREGLVVPEGLLRLLKSYTINEEESPDRMRNRIYRRLWCLMWYGTNIGESVVVGTTKKPTYVYPACVKEVVRAIVPGDLSDYPDPTGPHVYHVTLRDMQQAKWPASKKKKN